jgi:hypothetical protein
MTTSLPHDELSAVRELLDALLTALDGQPPPEDAAGIELLALTVQGPFALPDAPSQLAQELPAALARRGDGVAADMLTAIERLAPEPLAGFAAERRRELAAAGVSAALAADVGTATVAEASVLAAPDGEAELWHAVLRRPASADSQWLIVFVEHEPCGAVIVGAVLGAPDEPAAASELLRRFADRPAKPIRTGELTRRLRSALAHMERHAVPLDVEAARILPLLERALTGRAGRLPRPPAAPPLPALDDEDAEETELRENADALVDAFAAALERDEDAEPDLREHGPFVAHSALEWKIGYADRRLERWTLGDLRELLLDWFPRKVTADEETIAIAAGALSRFLRFLADDGLLDAPVPLASLQAAVERLRPRFEQACRDPRNWGLAKTMAARMAADGVDPHDGDAVQEWIASFNARPPTERDAVLGPAAGRMLAAAGPAPARKRAKRKAARRARKRNRR